MSINFALITPVLHPFIFGAAIAGAHLLWLRLSLGRVDSRHNPALSQISMSFIRMLSVATVLMLLARQLEPVPLIVLISSYVVTRLLLVRQLT